MTASAGNHGRALATAAAAARLRLTVFAPETAPRTKLDAIAALGARLELRASYDAAESAAKAMATATGARYISPYSHPDVIAGAGTIALEILEDWPEVEVIVAAVGGGGLLAGLATAVAPTGTVGITGVEVEASAPFTASLAAGHIVEIDVQPTLADGLAGNLDPDTITFDIVRHLVERIVVVGEHDLRDAVRQLVSRERLVVEGAAAAAVAAVTSAPPFARGRRVAIVLSGANIDPETLAALV